jgi:putative heme-binding domain-containing protein
MSLIGGFMRGLFAVFVLVPVSWAQTPAGGLFDAQADPQSGRKLWTANCAVCHGAQGKGGRGPDLTTGKLRHGSTDDDLYRAMRNGIPGTEMPGFPLSELESLQLLSYVRALGRATILPPAGGDAARGRALFAGSGQCKSCHRVGNEGARVGPDLSDIGAQRAPVDLLASLLRPGERVPPERWYVQAATRDGRTITGRRLNEDSYCVQLIDLQDRLVTVVKDELRDYQLIKRSPMPSYDGKLTKEQLNDVVAYLASLKAGR